MTQCLLRTVSPRLAAAAVVVSLLSPPSAVANELVSSSPAELNSYSEEFGPIGGEPVLSPDLVGALDLALDASETLVDVSSEDEGSPAVVSNVSESAAPEQVKLPLKETIVSRPAGPAIDTSKAAPRMAVVAQAPATKQAAQAPKRPAWLRPLTRSEMQLRERVRNVNRAYASWRPNTRDHSPWEILHVIVAHGTDSQILVDGPHGTPTTAVGWLCYNRPFRKMELLNPTSDGFRPRQGPGYEGHHGQFLGMLAQARVMRDYPIRVRDDEFTVEDLIRYEQLTCYTRTELTFKLIGLNHYLEPTATWENDRGEKWTIQRLVEEELVQTIRGAACGGTHRLEAMSMAVQKRERFGLPIEGPFAQAAKRVRDYQHYTFRLQNRDGSFSTQWFKGRGADSDPKRRMRTSGHQLEWLVISLPDHELRRPQLQRGVAYLANLLWQGRRQEWDAGLLGHSINALKIYNSRVFRRIEKFDEAESIAKKSTEPTAKR